MRRRPEFTEICEFLAVESRQVTDEARARKWRSTGAWAVSYVILWLALDLLWGGPTLTIDVDSTTAGPSQLFYRSVDDVYSERTSAKTQIHAGANQLSFDLPGVQKRLRWDPFDGVGTLDVHAVRVKAGWSTIPIRLDTARGAVQIASLETRGNGAALHVETEPDATDPAIFLEVPVSRIFWAKQLGAASLSALLLGVLFLCLRLDGWADRKLSSLRQILVDERPALNALPKLVVLAAAFHFTSLGSFALSPDDEYAAFRTNPDVWIAQGRWVVYLVEGFVLPQPTVPYLPNAIFCICVALAYLLLVRAHGLFVTWRAYLLFPLFCAFPTWWYIAEFYANLPSVSLGVVLASGAALAFRQTFVRPELAPSLPGRVLPVGAGLAAVVVLLGAAIGSYQSHLFAFVSYGLGIIGLSTLSEPGVRPRRVVKMLAALVASSALGAAFYWAIEQIVLKATGIEFAYIDQFIHTSLLFEHPGNRLRFLYDEVVATFSGSATVYGTPVGSVGVVIVLGATGIIGSATAPGRIWRAGTLLLLSGLVLFVPIAMMTVGPDLPLRSLVGVPYAVWLFGVLSMSHRLSIPRLAAGLVAAFTAFQFAYLLSLYAASTAITQSHDRALAASVYERIATTNEDFDRRKTYPVDFFGSKSLDVKPYPSAPTSTLGRTFFDWDGGNPLRIVTYMALLGYDNLTTVSADRRRRLTSDFEPMPAWPAAGSVKVVDGVTLVKLGMGPDPGHE